MVLVFVKGDYEDVLDELGIALMRSERLQGFYK